MGYADSSNLYAAFANDPVNNSDPLGTSVVSDHVDQFVAPFARWLAGQSPTLASSFGWGVGVYESALEMGYGMTLHGQLEMLAGVTQAYATGIGEGYRQDGLLGAAAGGAEVWAGTTQSIMLGLPVVNTIRQIAAIPDAYNAGSFEGGRQVGRATFSLGLDATLAYGAYRSLRAPKSIAGDSGLSQRGYRPAPGERALTQEQWRAEYRAARISRGPGRSWTGTREGYWEAIGEQELASPSGKYSETNITRMLAGRAPRMRVEVMMRRTGRVVTRDVSLELSHRVLTQRMRTPTAHEPWNLDIATPWAHEGMDPFRHTGYDLIRIINGPGTF